MQRRLQRLGGLQRLEEWELERKILTLGEFAQASPEFD